MKITINIDKKREEDLGAFTLRDLTPELSKIIAQLQSLDFKLIATKNEQKIILDFDKITTIYAANKHVYVLLDDKQEFIVSQTLTDLSNRLAANFLRISNSEIVNAAKISHFEFTFGGKIKICFKNGSHTYSSRGYLREIKRYFGL